MLSFYLEGPLVSKKIYQVIDDLQDAVLGDSPKVWSLNQHRKNAPRNFFYIIR